jgi:hypothetical protein
LLLNVKHVHDGVLYVIDFDSTRMLLYTAHKHTYTSTTCPRHTMSRSHTVTPHSAGVSPPWECACHAARDQTKKDILSQDCLYKASCISSQQQPQQQYTYKCITFAPSSRYARFSLKSDTLHSISQSSVLNFQQPLQPPSPPTPS